MQLVFRALADPTRRAVIEILCEAPHSIGEINAEFELTRTAIVKHLRILEDAGIVESKTIGRERISTLNPQALQPAADWINHLDQFWENKLELLKQVVESDYEQTDD